MEQQMAFHMNYSQQLAHKLMKNPLYSIGRKSTGLNSIFLTIFIAQKIMNLHLKLQRIILFHSNFKLKV